VLLLPCLKRKPYFSVVASGTPEVMLRGSPAVIAAVAAAAAAMLYVTPAISSSSSCHRVVDVLYLNPS
jgi:hypothetical protein